MPISNCDAAIAWYACTLYDGGNGKWQETIYADELVWCEQTGVASGCLDVGRVAQHELGHAAGLSRSADNGGNDAHSTESELFTVMRLSTPKNPNSGWSTGSPQECDVIELQREYGMANAAGTIPACIDELPGLVGGKLPSVAAQNAPSLSIACPNEAVTFSGTLKLGVSASYGLLSGAPLGRTVALQRKPTTVGATWTTVATVVTTTTGTWSRALSMTSGTYDFRIIYGGDATIAAVNGATKQVKWQTPC